MQQELWDVYDANRVKTGRTHRRGVPLPPGDYHLAVFVWIRGGGGKYLITQRAPQAIRPLLWQATGGSALAGEDSLSAALREAREETGIALRPETGMLCESLLLRDCIADVWLFHQQISLSDFVPQPGETVDACLASPEDLRALVGEGKTFFALEHIEPLFLFADALDREERFVCPPPSTPRAAIESLLAADFCEVGASGQIHPRAECVQALLRRRAAPPSEPWAITDFALRPLADDLHLATYTLTQGARQSRRSTLWRREGVAWRALYHQGTLWKGESKR